MMKSSSSTGLPAHVASQGSATATDTQSDLESPRPALGTGWKRFADEMPTYDGWGERWLLTWNVRVAAYDLGCVDGGWDTGEAASSLSHPDDLWRWLEENPEAARGRLAPTTEMIDAALCIYAEAMDAGYSRRAAMDGAIRAALSSVVPPVSPSEARAGNPVADEPPSTPSAEGGVL